MIQTWPDPQVLHIAGLRESRHDLLAAREIAQEPQQQHRDESGAAPVRNHSNHDILYMVWPRLVLIEPYPVRKYVALPVRTLLRGEIAVNA